jgi:hypothetical protein
MPVSGAQQAWKHEILQAAVHSTYRRFGSGPTFRSRTGAGWPSASGSLSGQSPQNHEPPALMSARSSVAIDPRHTDSSEPCRTSPMTRFA